MILWFSSRPNKKHSSGFTLIEIAVVLVVIGLLLGALIAPLSSQRDLANRQKTDNLLLEINNALLGFAATHGRLPCPATTASNGLASPNTATNNCQQEHGFIPARTLGLVGAFNDNNLLLEAWGNPVRYSLSSVSSWEYANQISLTVTTPSYRICDQRACANANILAEEIVAVVYSTGKDGGLATSSPDQVENIDGDNDFVTRAPSEGTNTEFDDQLRWLSPAILLHELIRSGQLNGS